MSRYRLIAAAALVAGLVAVPVAAAKRTPQITAKPGSVMVNQMVKVKGKGFAPDATLTVEECGKSFWTVPDDPCVHTNSVTVTTNAKGKFKTTMSAAVCPEAVMGVGTSETCYIGVPSFGLDTVSLPGAAQVTVSWP